MLALVILQPFGEAKTGVVQADKGRVIAAAGNPVEPEYRKHSELRGVQDTGSPGIPSQLAARAIVGIGGEDTHACRVNSPIVGDDVPNDVVGYGRRHPITGRVKLLCQMGRAQQSLFLAGIEREYDCCLETRRKPLRENSRELDYRGGARAVVIGAGRVGSEVESVYVADARIVMAADYDHAAGVASPQPCQHVHDVYFGTLRMAGDLYHGRVVFDAEAAVAFAAVSAQTIMKEPPRGSDPARRADRIRHCVSRPERDKDRISLTDACCRDVIENPFESGIAPKPDRCVDSLGYHLARSQLGGHTNSGDRRARGEGDTKSQHRDQTKDCRSHPPYIARVNPPSEHVTIRSPTLILAWQLTPFDELSPADLYAAMQLRQHVFVLEQTCPYMDADGADAGAEHLFGWLEPSATTEGNRRADRDEDASRRLVAYARIFPPRVKYAEASIGRVVTHPDFRGTGTGKALMSEAIRRVAEAGWGSEIRIVAQMYLERFYEGFGFQRVSEPYTEDDIWHVDMLRG